MSEIRKLYSDEAEQNVLGALLQSHNDTRLQHLIDDVREILAPEAFAVGVHQEVAKAIFDLHNQGRPVDPVTVADHLESQPHPEDGVDRFAYVVDLARNTLAHNIPAYAEIVRERFQERQLHQVGREIQELMLTPGLKHQERVEQAQTAFTALACERPASTQIDLNESLTQVVGRLERRLEGDAGEARVATGLRDVDQRLLGGMGRGELLVVGARPAMGKTTYGMGYVRACLHRDEKAMVFSLEMPHAQLTERLLAAEAGVRLDWLKDPRQVPGDQACDFWDAISKATVRLRGRPLVIDDQGDLSLQELRSRARREARKGPVSLILVDYLQLMRVGGRTENRTQEVSEISRGLKALSKELDCVVVALSQLNRSLENRPNKRPIMADLRESGSIEQDADVIQFLYRDEVYNEDSMDKGIAEIITGKFRDGQPGTDRVLFQGASNRFADLARPYQEYQAQAQAHYRHTKQEDGFY